MVLRHPRLCCHYVTVLHDAGRFNHKENSTEQISRTCLAGAAKRTRAQRSLEPIRIHFGIGSLRFIANCLSQLPTGLLDWAVITCVYKPTCSSERLTLITTRCITYRVITTWNQACLGGPAVCLVRSVGRSYCLLHVEVMINCMSWLKLYARLCASFLCTISCRLC